MVRVPSGRLSRAAAVIMLALVLTSCAQMSPLHKAALEGDVGRIDEYIRKGVPVNGRDARGNTPLHYAYYHGQQAAVDSLIAYGADLTIRNKDGDTPLDMGRIREAEALIGSGARVLDVQGDWTNRSKGRRVYDDLRKMDGLMTCPRFMYQSP